jgi:hypothetical protein
MVTEVDWQVGGGGDGRMYVFIKLIESGREG